MLAAIIVLLFPLLKLQHGGVDSTNLNDVDAFLFAFLSATLGLFQGVVADMADPWSGLCSVGGVRDTLLQGVLDKAVALEEAGSVLVGEPADLVPAPGAPRQARRRAAQPPLSAESSASWRRTWTYNPSTGQLREQPAPGDA